MKYRRLSLDRDYVFGFGNNCFVSGSDAVAQAIQTKLKMFQGDYWENLEDGLPFFQEIAGEKNVSAIDLLYQSRVLEVPNVTGIESFSSSLADRQYTATMTVTTSFGTTVEVTI